MFPVSCLLLYVVSVIIFFWMMVMGFDIKRQQKKLLTGIGPVTSALPRRRSTD